MKYLVVILVGLAILAWSQTTKNDTMPKVSEVVIQVQAPVPASFQAPEFCGYLEVVKNGLILTTKLNYSVDINSAMVTMNTPSHVGDVIKFVCFR